MWLHLIVHFSPNSAAGAYDSDSSLLQRNQTQVISGSRWQSLVQTFQCNIDPPILLDRGAAAGGKLQVNDPDVVGMRNDPEVHIISGHEERSTKDSRRSRQLWLRVHKAIESLGAEPVSRMQPERPDAHCLEALLNNGLHDGLRMIPR
jgi:hypothetical protein